jgi:hypothetical protein
VTEQINDLTADAGQICTQTDKNLDSYTLALADHP